MSTLSGRVLTFFVVALLLVGCGGDEDDEVSFVRVYEGTVAGSDCFLGTPVSIEASYTVAIDDLSEGSAATLSDQEGKEWRGSMTSESSLVVQRPEADERLSIVMTGITENAAHVDATISCVSFRCCTTLAGELTVPQITAVQ